MNSNSNPISKRLKTETNTDDQKTSIANVSPRSASSGTGVAISDSDDGSNTCIAVFTEDILPIIFDSLEILTRKDLLHFRLVNRCWRDAATSMILKRNLCEIRLDFGKVTIDEDGKEVGEFGGFRFMHDETLEPISDTAYKYFNICRPKCFLSDLNKLISTSAKFPCDSFYFDTECGYGFQDLCQPSDWTDADQHRIDLFHFFSLYRRKIRKLTLSSEISKEAVQNLLYVHMPHLVCLNIKDIFLPDDESDETNGESEIPVCLSPPSTLNIEEVILGYVSSELPANIFNFVKELISVSPKLSILQDVHTSSLEFLLEMKKCHLVNELHFDDPLPTSLQFRKLLTDSILPNRLQSVPRLQLSKLTVWLNSDLKSSHEHNAIVKGLHLIVSASKNSLKCFEFRMIPSDNLTNLFIPPLPHLKCLKLMDRTISRSVTTRFHFLGDVIGQGVQSKKVNADHHSVEDFNALVLQNQENISNIPPNYFPRLCQVKLCADKTREYQSDKLMGFFAVEHVIRPFCLFIPVTIVPGDALLTVNTLKLTKFAWFDKDIAKSFPEVTYLKIDCEYSTTPQNWIWKAFPKLERFEIARLPDSWDTKYVDSFFTGISAKLCAQFRADATSINLTGRRTKPYIGDSEKLKEFKIGFYGKLTSKFASKVTAFHGFSQVIHRTKIIFSFKRKYFRSLDVKDIPETRKFLDPVADYIEFHV